VDIFINGESLNFTLEDEKQLGEVYDNVHNWLSDQGFLVMKAEEENRDLTAEEANRWREKPLSEVISVEFEVKSITDMSFEILQPLHQYLLLLVKGIEQRNFEVLSDLADDFKTIETRLNQLFSSAPEKGKNSDILLFRSCIQESGIFEGEIKNKDAFDASLNLTRGFLSLVEERIREITAPREEFLNTIEELAKSIEPINEIPVLLQTGKDREAMRTVIQFTELSQKLIRLFPILKVSEGFDMQQKLSSGESLEEYYEDLKSILLEVNEAFIAKDSVLIGDLLEYEVSPRLENLVTITDSLKG
jgi:hypothetical protein